MYPKLKASSDENFKTCSRSYYLQVAGKSREVVCHLQLLLLVGNKELATCSCHRRIDRVYQDIFLCVVWGEK